ncbi:CDP-alcohol phosphatidyltransferase family protein [Ruegeria lacuscaerulensis]|uniref:CDP-alcohol phosphatidyltransferase family protein n=1 Tax=Ruegeria lacuscaerulensis TaxID=55218 RepID=UPI001F2A3657|nr:CDP-alcohol phosphatidyltransferase family protein [Ruegeria lacuscaerulensis]
MKAHRPLGPVTHSQAFSPVSVFAGQAVVMGAGLALAASMALPSVFWALSAFLVATVLSGAGLVSRYPHSVLGLCNTTTLLRAALVAFLFGTLFFTTEVSGWLVFAVGAFAFALDGLDGWFARRSGLQSDFGARFDMETDAALGAVLALWVMLSGTAQAYVLILGFARYAFVAAGWVWPQLRGNLPPSFRRKAVCVVQIAALLLLVFPLTPAAVLAPLSLTASLALSYSFGADIHWLLRQSK